MIDPSKEGSSFSLAGLNQRNAATMDAPDQAFGIWYFKIYLCLLNATLSKTSARDQRPHQTRH